MPSGATVRSGGRTLVAGAVGSYELPIGSHSLVLRSNTGEETTIAVSVKAGETVDVCYSFDTNSAGGRAP